MNVIDPSQLRDEAADWLVRRDAGLSTSDEKALADWLAASPAHARAWEQALTDWARFDQVGGDLFEVMRAQALAAKPEPAQAAWRGLIAASLVAAAVLGGVMGWRHLSPSRAPQQASPVVQMLAAHTQRTDRRLPDGTLATLDRNTVIEIRFDETARRVTVLDGQVYFDVAAVKARPFLVRASDKTVTDIGTRFSVRRDPAGLVTVTLQDGAVSIGEGARTVTLRPGEQYQAPTGAAGSVKPVDPDRAMAWRYGYLEFRQTRLDEAVAEINRYGGPPIRLMGSRIGALPISGRFPIDDARGFADAIAAIHPLEVDQDKTGIILRPAR
ncbi:FecR domain-containing protein [Caulobacter sp. UNC279MFTsu5.1]|uniref:FecR family protein n=1 Tax=Caulobacter sp. UNC279MFTsu5.1 TaxID=1502775 RepID=UPI0008F3335F|nr:FecR domain-containing protein [Caulobacter sp. UNC279MFTsu5.1]SFI53072.1 FecR family protein [Caulobacter sp. UNC279MFTsu5.1]